MFSNMEESYFFLVGPGCSQICAFSGWSYFLLTPVFSNAIAVPGVNLWVPNVYRLEPWKLLQTLRNSQSEDPVPKGKTFGPPRSGTGAGLATPRRSARLRSRFGRNLLQRRVLTADQNPWL